MWHGGSEDVWQRHQPLDHLLAKPQVQPEWPYSGGGGAGGEPRYTDGHGSDSLISTSAAELIDVELDGAGSQRRVNCQCKADRQQPSHGRERAAVLGGGSGKEPGCRRKSAYSQSCRMKPCVASGPAACQSWAGSWRWRCSRCPVGRKSQGSCPGCRAPACRKPGSGGLRCAKSHQPWACGHLGEVGGAGSQLHMVPMAQQPQSPRTGPAHSCAASG